MNSSDKKEKISTNSGWKYFLRRKELKSNWIFIGKEEEGVLKKKKVEKEWMNKYWWLGQGTEFGTGSLPVKLS